MHIPPAPPRDTDLLHDMTGERLLTVMAALDGSTTMRRYRAWDEMRFRAAPAGVSAEEFWLVTRMSRRATARPIALLRDVDGRAFSFNLPDPLLADVDAIGRDAAGRAAVPDQVTNPATRDRYLVSSLMEEAIRSSQLEGAATTRQVAKDMLRQGRAPRNSGERMILNNYAAMQNVAARHREPLTPEMIRELHAVVTDGTLADPSDAGRLQRPTDERIAVFADTGDLLHRPPPAEQLPERLERLCTFANGGGDDIYIPPLLRAIAVHFMMGYDHYFADGNGRTARAVFYWSMLNQGFWLTEFLTISRILKAAPATYARAFLRTELDEGDLTHFFLHQTAVIRRAIGDLHVYLARKSAELRSVQAAARSMPGEFNHRELALLEHAVRNPGAVYTVESHRKSHRVSTETARQDLRRLADKGLLTSGKTGRRFTWSPAADLAIRMGVAETSQLSDTKLLILS